MMTQDNIDIPALRFLAAEKITEILDHFYIDYEDLGEEVRCRCPIHDGDNPSSFCFWRSISAWNCFTRHCHEDYSGDVIGLVRALLEVKEGNITDWKGAANWIIDFINADHKQMECAAKYVKKMEKKPQSETNGKFKSFLVDNIKDFRISKYFSNQFNESTLNHFLVTDCLDSHNFMYNRACVYILDELGLNVIGVSGRIMMDECEFCGGYHKGYVCKCDDSKVINYPKWVHYGFRKSVVLYNLWNAKSDIEKTQTAVVVEGPKDCWWLFQHGVYNVVSTLGLKLNHNHISKLTKLGVKRIVYALDNDDAGLTAINKSMSVVSRHFDIKTMIHLMNEGEDIADIDTERMNNIICPFLHRMEYDFSGK